MRQVIEKVIEHDSSVQIGSVDLPKAFDSVPRHALFSLLKEYGVEEEVCRLIIVIYNDTGCVVKTKGGKSNRFRVTTGVKQGCCLSPVLCNIHIHKIIRKVLSLGDRGGIEIEYKTEDNFIHEFSI